MRFPLEARRRRVGCQGAAEGIGGLLHTGCYTLLLPVIWSADGLVWAHWGRLRPLAPWRGPGADSTAAASYSCAAAAVLLGRAVTTAYVPVAPFWAGLLLVLGGSRRGRVEVLLGPLVSR